MRTSWLALSALPAALGASRAVPRAQLVGHLGGTPEAIVGGQDAPTSGAFDFAVALVTEEAQLSEVTYYWQYCGGSLVDAEWVLTAAHCVDGSDPTGGGMTVMVGWQDFTDETDADALLVDVDYVASHPDYGSSSTTHDVAMLHLSEPVDFATVALAEAADAATLLATGNELTVVGWGLTEAYDDDVYEATCADECEADGECLEACNTFACLLDFGDCADEVDEPTDVVIASGDPTLQEVDVPVYDFDECDDAYEGAVDDTMFCAGYEAGGQDSCSGDSGGAILDADSLTQVGIVSWGYDCAEPGYPGVYASVPALRDFIDQYLGASFVVDEQELYLYGIGDVVTDARLSYSLLDSESVLTATVADEDNFAVAKAEDSDEFVVSFVGGGGADVNTTLTVSDGAGSTVDVLVLADFEEAIVTMGGLQWAVQGANWTVNDDGSVTPTDDDTCLYAVMAEPGAVEFYYVVASPAYTYWQAGTVQGGASVVLAQLSSYAGVDAADGDALLLVTEAPDVVWVCTTGGTGCGSFLTADVVCDQCMCQGDLDDDTGVCECHAGWEGDSCTEFDAQCTDGAEHDLQADEGSLLVTEADYVNNLECSWELSQAENATVAYGFVEFTVESFDIEYGWDDLDVVWGDGSTAEYTGFYEAGTTWCGPGPTVTVTFDTDGSVTDPGFELSYAFVESCSSSSSSGSGSASASHDPDVCYDTEYTCEDGGTHYLDANDGCLMVSEEDYDNNLECSWVLQSDVGDADQLFAITADFFDVESGWDYVYLSFADGQEVSLTGSYAAGTSWCGEGPVTVSFDTDGSVLDTGFNLAYEAVETCDEAPPPFEEGVYYCEGNGVQAITLEGNDSVALISHYSGEYNNDENCGFVLPVPEDADDDQVIVWIPDATEIEAGWDFLSVVDGPLRLTEVSGDFSAGELACVVAETALGLVFSTDGSVAEELGWSGTASLMTRDEAALACPVAYQPCSVVLDEAAAGHFGDPSDPALCHSICSYTIPADAAHRVELRILDSYLYGALEVRDNPFSAQGLVGMDAAGDAYFSSSGPLYAMHYVSSYDDEGFEYEVQQLDESSFVALDDYLQHCAVEACGDECSTDEWGLCAVSPACADPATLDAGAQSEFTCTDITTTAQLGFDMSSSGGHVLSALTTLHQALVDSEGLDATTAELLLMAAYPGLSLCLSQGGIKNCDLVWAASPASERHDWFADAMGTSEPVDLDDDFWGGGDDDFWGGDDDFWGGDGDDDFWGEVFDELLSDSGDLSQATAALVEQTQIQNTLVQASALLTGLQSAGRRRRLNVDADTSAAVTAMASLAAAGEVVDLEDEGVVEAVLADAVDGAGLEADDATLAAASGATAAVNELTSEAVDGADDDELLYQLSLVSYVSNTHLADMTASVASGDVTPEDYAEATSDAALEGFVGDAESDVDNRWDTSPDAVEKDNDNTTIIVVATLAGVAVLVAAGVGTAQHRREQAQAERQRLNAHGRGAAGPAGVVPPAASVPVAVPVVMTPGNSSIPVAQPVGAPPSFQAGASSFPTPDAGVDIQMSKLS